MSWAGVHGWFGSSVFKVKEDAGIQEVYDTTHATPSVTYTALHIQDVAELKFSAPLSTNILLLSVVIISI